MPKLRPPVIRLALTLCAAGLAGCGGVITQSRMGPVNEMIPPLPDRCGMAGLADLVGQDFTALADRPLAGPLRVVWPGQEVEGEVQPHRVNAQVTADQRIIRLFCG